MSRRSNVIWETPDGANFKWEHVAIEVLMDIRAELQELNRTLGCFRMRRMSDDIARIDKRLQVRGMATYKRKAK